MRMSPLQSESDQHFFFVGAVGTEELDSVAALCRLSKGDFIMTWWKQQTGHGLLLTGERET